VFAFDEITEAYVVTHGAVGEEVGDDEGEDAECYLFVDVDIEEIGLQFIEEVAYKGGGYECEAEGFCAHLLLEVVVSLVEEVVVDGVTEEKVTLLLVELYDGVEVELSVGL